MMTDPAFPMKNEVQRLVDVQIDTLRKPSSITSSELDEYRSRSERISALYEQLDLIVRKRFNARSQTAARNQSRFEGDRPPLPAVSVERRPVS